MLCKLYAELIILLIFIHPTRIAAAFLDFRLPLNFHPLQEELDTGSPNQVLKETGVCHTGIVRSIIA